MDPIPDRKSFLRGRSAKFARAGSGSGRTRGRKKKAKSTRWRIRRNERAEGGKEDTGKKILKVLIKSGEGRKRSLISILVLKELSLECHPFFFLLLLGVAGLHTHTLIRKVGILESLWPDHSFLTWNLKVKNGSFCLTDKVTRTREHKYSIPFVRMIEKIEIPLEGWLCVRHRFTIFCILSF